MTTTWTFNGPTGELLTSNNPNGQLEKDLSAMEAFLSTYKSTANFLGDLTSRLPRCSFLSDEFRTEAILMAALSPEVQAIGQRVGVLVGSFTCAKTLLAGSFSAPVQSYVNDNCCAITKLPETLQKKIAEANSAAKAKKTRPLEEVAADTGTGAALAQPQPVSAEAGANSSDAPPAPARKRFKGVKAIPAAPVPPQ